MRPKSSTPETRCERLARDIRRARRKQYSAEEKIRIVLDGPRGDATIAELCRREGIAEEKGCAGSYAESRLSATCDPRCRTGDHRRDLQNHVPAA